MSELSPSARAVLDAAYEELDYVPRRHVRWAAAAALQAAADQVVPPDPCGDDCAIATELNGTNPSEN